jgi:hypothetical protein
MKKIYKNSLIVIIALLALGIITSIAVAENFGLHQIIFNAATYDPMTNATTFTYQVIAGWNYPFDSWQITLNPECFGAGSIVDASEPYEYLSPDPVSGVTGIRFTQPYAANESRMVWFEIKGNVLVAKVSVALKENCTYWFKYLDGPECGGLPQPPPGEYNGKTIGYWKHQLAVYLRYNKGNMQETKENLTAYLSRIGLTAEQAYNILSYKGSDMASLLNKQLVAAKLNLAAGYLWAIDALIAQASYMVAHPSEFERIAIEDVKNQVEALNTTGD